MYKEVDPKIDFSKQEEEILAFWEKNDVFKKSVSRRDGCEEYVFYDGPPFATGLPHFGHFIPGTIKDIIPRYQTMKGKKVERRFGWDCHGLPVENLIEKELNLNGKADIEKYGIAKFNEACRASVLRYVKEWKQTVTRLGRWVDFDNDYKTMEPEYMESIWWVMKSLWDKGLLYEGHYILPYCPRCATVLSNHELNLGGYKDVHDPAITIRFKVNGIPDGFDDKDVLNGNTYFLAWTTTPWTLPSNLGLTAGPDIDYVKVKDGDEYYILAESRLGAYYKNENEYSVIWKKKGAELKDMRYEPLFPYFASLAEPTDGSDGNPASIGAFRVFTGDFVTTEDGTGLVHTAPGFGEDDNKVFKGTGIPVVCPIDGECKFTAEVPDYEGRFVKDCDKDILERLKNEKKLVKRDQILHAYPHCWRCSSPLIYRAIGSWFVKVESIRPALLKANNQITWQPAHIKTGRFGKWLEGARDWAISRNRYWGNPLPIWKCPDCGKTLCVGSREDLKKLSGVYPEDLHKQFIDKITIPCSCGGTMSRIPEVLDCWFESGSMPYAQNHYPFENKEYFESHFPADFISEGLDQTRGWFYTLTILAAALFDKPAFKNCIVNGLILASDGKKMSKSLRNYTDPAVVIERFGADAVRLFLMHSAAVKADDLKYSDEGVRDILKGILIPLWNSYGFFVTYANIDKVRVTGKAFEHKAPLNPLDRWILSVTQKLVKDVTEAMDSYDLSAAIDPIVGFIDQLNNWYIRRSRRRFWKSENDDDKLEAYESLYTALKTLTLTAAPFIPFITEAMWQNLRIADFGSEGADSAQDACGDPVSVHLADYPVYDEQYRDGELEFKMATVQKAVSMGRALRYQYNLKIRQPLKSVEFVTRNADEKTVLLSMEESIREELNVKKVVFHEREDELVEYKAKANFRTLGKELGPLMKEASALIAGLDQRSIQSVLDGAVLSIEIGGKPIELTQDKIIVERFEKSTLKVVNEGTLTVALDSEITEELRLEGYARDLVRGVQNLRKERGLNVTDRIKLSVGADKDKDGELKKAFEMFSDYIASETLASEERWNDRISGAALIETGELTWKAEIEKRKLKSAPVLLFLLCAFVCLFFEGCKTLSMQKESIDLFTLFDDGADVYLHIPVNEANKSFVRNLVNAWTDDINESDLKNMLNRTEEIAAAFFIEWGANLKSTVKFQLASRGKYPSFLINAGLTKKNGWTDVSEKAADMILNRKRHSNNIELASPDNNHLFISNKDVLSMQKKYFLYLISPASTPDWPSLPGENTALPVRTLMDDAELVSVYMPTAGSLLPKMVGSPIELGIKYAAGTLKSYKEDHAIVTLKLQMSDERSLKIAEKLFRFAVLGTNIIVKQDRGTVLILDNFVVWPAALTGLLQKKR